jgi:hypothetical protein
MSCWRLGPARLNRSGERAAFRNRENDWFIEKWASLGGPSLPSRFPNRIEGPTMIRCLLTLVLVAVSATLAAADDNATLEQLRTHVDANGRITDAALRDQTGCQVMRGFVWSIDLADAANANKFTPADPMQTFKQGQRFRVRIEAFCDLYVYVLNQNSDGSAEVLLPTKTEKVPLVKRGQSVLLPDDDTSFKFTPPAGTETLRVIAAPMELPWVASAELFKLQTGQELTQQESSVLDQIKGLRARGASAKSIEDVKLTKVAGTATAPQAKSVGSVQGAIKAIGEGKRSRQLLVEAATGNSKGLLVTHASPDSESKAILVYEIALKHDK